MRFSKLPYGSGTQEFFFPESKAVTRIWFTSLIERGAYYFFNNENQLKTPVLIANHDASIRVCWMKKFAMTLIIRWVPGLIFCIAALAFGKNPISISGDLSKIPFNSIQKVFLVKSNIKVPIGKYVCIPAGTVLMFDTGASFFIYGEYAIKGTESNPVVCTSINESTQGNEPALPFDWNGIIISRSAPRVVFENLLIKNAEHPLTSDCPNFKAKGVRRYNTKDDFFTINRDSIEIPLNSQFTYDSRHPLPEPAIVAPSPLPRIASPAPIPI
jgi:hypothetical protein